MSRVMLIQPPSNIMANRKESKPALQPYGLACIAALLRQHGHEVQIYDMLAEGYWHEVPYHVGNTAFIRYGDGMEQLHARLGAFTPDIVGVSCIAALRHFEACDVVKWVKIFDKRIVTVMGGNHPSTMFDLVLKECGDNLNYLIVGEGEYPMLNIANKKHPSVMVTKLDDMPTAAHDLLPLDKYVEIWRDMNYHFYDIKGRFISSSTSRGCVNRCHHCPHDAVFGKGWRPRTVESIEKEVRFAVEELGVKEVQFHEYNGQVDKQFMISVAKMMSQFDIRWGYPIGMWVKLLDEKLLQLMYDSGMDYINLAIESPSPGVLDTMPGKDVDVRYVDKVAKWCREIGYYINGFFMIGFPDETITDMEHTLTYATNLDIDTAAFFIMQPLPGTTQWGKVEFIADFHPMMLRYGKCNIKSKNWTAEQVEAIRHEGRKRFVRAHSKSGTKLRGGNFVVREC